MPKKKAKKIELHKDYYVPGQKHVCMFCERAIATLKNGKLVPNAMKTHVMLPKANGIYTINCCKRCANKTDFQDQAILDAIHEVVTHTNASAAKRAGLTGERVSKYTERVDNDPPVKGLVQKHVNTGEAAIKAVDRYKQWKERNK